MAEENKKKSFVVYSDWEEALSYFTDAEAGEIFRALFQYAKDGKMPEFSHNSLNAVFSFMKSALDRDKKAYEARCQKNRENGGKGGRPKKANGFEENPKKPNGYFEKPKKPDNDNVIDNVNDIDIDNDIDNVNDSVCIYGEFDNVFLSEEEYTHLQTQFPDSYNDIINKFSRGLKTYGYKYDCHYTAILQWVENDKKKEKEQTKSNTTSGNPFLNAAKETIGFGGTYL